MNSDIILADNFKKYKNGTIIMGVPKEKYFSKAHLKSSSTTSHTAYDVVKESDGTLGYNHVSDNMEFYDRNCPDYNRVQWNNKIQVGGLI